MECGPNYISIRLSFAIAYNVAHLLLCLRLALNSPSLRSQWLSRLCCYGLHNLLICAIRSYKQRNVYWTRKKNWSSNADDSSISLRLALFNWKLTFYILSFGSTMRRRNKKSLRMNGKEIKRNRIALEWVSTVCESRRETPLGWPVIFGYTTWRRIGWDTGYQVAGRNVFSVHMIPIAALVPTASLVPL